MLHDSDKILVNFGHDQNPSLAPTEIPALHKVLLNVVQLILTTSGISNIRQQHKDNNMHMEA